jgi:uncharacterized membrane protein YheB (UPF0754 family)
MVSWKKMYKECEYELIQYKSVFESCTAFLREIITNAIREVVESELDVYVEVVLNILYDDLPKMFEDAVKKVVGEGEVNEEALDAVADLFINVFEEFVAGELASRLEEVIEPIADEVAKRLIKKGVVDKIARKLLEDQRIKRAIERVYEECRKAISEY